MWSDEQVSALWGRFEGEGAGWRRWQEAYLAWVERWRATPDEVFRRPEQQEQLWEGRAVCALGNHEQVLVRGAWSDPELVEALLALRRWRWSPKPETRAQELEDAFQRLIEQVARHSTARPQAKLSRLMAALLPEELHCVVAFGASRELAELLLPDRRGRTSVSAQVLVRARLREVLGPEISTEEHVRRAVFCAWLHAQAEALRWEFGAASAPSPQASDAAAPLRLWPCARQHKGLALPPRGPSSLRDLLRLAADGLRPELLVEHLGLDPRYAASSSRARRQMVQLARGLGLLEAQGEALLPSPAGEELLGSDGLGPLIEQALRRTVGLAQALRLVAQGGPVPEDAWEAWAARHLSPPTSTWGAQDLAAWLGGLGLVERGPDRALGITPAGRHWAERLPAELPWPAAEVSWEQGPTSDAGRSFEPSWPSWEELRRGFGRDPDCARLVVEEGVLKALHLAWRSQPRKRFAILSGLSGTGKTAMAVAYARVTSHLLGLDPREHLALVAVSPDWRDPAGLLGYLHALQAEPMFLAEPALKLLLRAAAEPSKPFFLVLDEMNLARVERYLAPLLSAMETGEALALHTSPEPISGVPPSVAWPSNLFLAGTVNMDETTHPLSDKVLDRAFVVELWEADLPQFFARRATQGESPEPEAEAALVGLYDALRPVRRHFGYRSAGEVLGFIAAAKRAEPGRPQAAREALDQALAARVLTRVRGEDSPALRQALGRALEVCRGLPRCEAKLAEMLERLSLQGVTRFWG